MISRIQLAKDWHLSVFEVHRIMAFADQHHLDISRAHQMYRKVNDAFAACVQQTQKNGKYVGVLCSYDVQHRPNISATTKEFDTGIEAAKSLNQGLLANGRFNFPVCCVLRVLPEAITLIRPIPEKAEKTKDKSVALGATRQRSGR